MDQRFQPEWERERERKREEPGKSRHWRYLRRERERQRDWNFFAALLERDFRTDDFYYIKRETERDSRGPSFWFWEIYNEFISERENEPVKYDLCPKTDLGNKKTDLRSYLTELKYSFDSLTLTFRYQKKFFFFFEYYQKKLREEIFWSLGHCDFLFKQIVFIYFFRFDFNIRIFIKFNETANKFKK